MDVKENDAEKEYALNTNRKSSPRIRYSRFIYSIFAWIFVLSIIIQVFLAGMAVFESPVHWGRHVNFGHLFSVLPLFMFALGFLGRLPRWMIWWSLGLLAMMILQSVTANGLAPALHPVIALVLFLVGFMLARRSIRFFKHSEW